MKLAEALRALVERLDARKVPFAVVGGLATSARGEARFTRDVDLAVAVHDDEAERMLFDLSRAGYVVVATVEQDATGRLATARLRAPDGTVCDLVFATSGVEPEVVASAEPLELFPDLRLPTASVESLLAMKTLSATPQRPRDLEDIRAMLAANPDFDESVVVDLLSKIEERGYARGQRLLDKWRDLKKTFANRDET